MKRPCVKKNPQGLLIYGFQVGNFLIAISRERDKKSLGAKEVDQGVYSHCGVWDVRGILLTKGIMQETTESFAVSDESLHFFHSWKRH